MTRIFTTLAVFALLAMLGTLALGLALRGADIRDPADETAQRWATVHRLSGIATGVAVVFVNSIVITYFIGTSRWCKEVSEAYALPTTYVVRSTTIKRRAFPLAVANMLVVVAIIALGGAADPAGSFRVAPPAGMAWADLHFLAGTAGLCWMAYASFAEAGRIAENHAVIEEILVEVRRIRAERGLD